VRAQSEKKTVFIREGRISLVIKQAVGINAFSAFCGSEPRAMKAQKKWKRG